MLVNLNAIPGKVVERLVLETISKCPQFPRIERKLRPSAVGSEGDHAALELLDPE